MSYIGLLNESIVTTYNNVSATDDLTVGTSLRNLGTLTQIGAATFSGSLSGLLAAVSNGTDLTYTYNPGTKTFTIQINNNSITNSKLLYSTIVINGISISLGNSITLTTSDIPEGTNLYYTSAKAQADAKLAISSTDSTEIDFTYLAGNITANLKDNSIDISRIKNTQIATANTANTLVLRDVYGNFSTGSINTIGITNNTMPIINNSTLTQIGAVKLGSAGTNAGSLNVYNATNTDYLQIATTANMSTISTNGTGVRQLALVAQSTNIYNALVTAPISVRDANLSSIYIALNNTGINLTYGLNYQINGIEYLATKSTTNLIEGTNLYYSVARFLSQFALMNTGNLTEGTNLYYTDLRFDNRLTTKTTNDLIQGTTNKYYATSLFNLDLATKTTNDLIQGTANKYYASSLFNSDLAAKTTNDLLQGTTNKYLNALTTTSPNEITLTLAANNLSGSLINNTIDISKLKTTQIDISNTANTLVLRDTTGSFSANAISAGSLSASLLSLNYDGIRGTYINSSLNWSLSPLRPANNLYIDTDNHGTLYLNQNLTTSAVVIKSPTTINGLLTANAGINIATGQTYNINGSALNTDNISDIGRTNKYLSSLTINSIPVGSINQIIQTNGTTNSWVTMSGDATLSAGVLTLDSTNINNRIQNYIASNSSSNNLGTYSGATSFTNPSAKFGTTTANQGIVQLYNGSTATSTMTSSSISGTVLTVGGMNNTVCIGMILTGTSVLTGTMIISYGTGVGGPGTYNVNYSQTVASTTITGTLFRSSIIATDTTKNLYIDNADGGALNLNSFNSNTTMKVGCVTTFYRSLNLQPLSTANAADIVLKTYTGTATIQMTGDTGDLNITGTYLYAGSNIVNTVQADSTTLSFVPTVSSNSWQVITGLTCSGITTRRTTSKVRINVTIGLCFCGTPATSLYFSVGKIQGGTTSYDIPSGLVGSGGSTYGLTAVQAIYGYGTVSFQYITNQSSAVGSVQYFVSTRIGSINSFTSNPNIGFLSSGQTAGCAQIFCEELLC